MTRDHMPAPTSLSPNRGGSPSPAPLAKLRPPSPIHYSSTPRRQRQPHLHRPAKISPVPQRLFVLTWPEPDVAAAALASTLAFRTPASNSSPDRRFSTRAELKLIDMDHEQRRQRPQHSPRGNAPGNRSGGASSGKHKGGGGKGGGRKPIKVVYISNPMRVKTSASGFRALVQELTGRDADPSKYSPEDEDLAGAADAAVAAADLDCGAAQGLSPGGAAASSETIVAIPSPAAADHLPDAAAEAAPHGGDYYYYYDDDDEDGFGGSQLLENNYTVFSPPTLLYDHHPHSKFPFC